MVVRPFILYSLYIYVYMYMPNPRKICLMKFDFIQASNSALILEKSCVLTVFLQDFLPSPPNFDLYIANLSLLKR